MRDSSDRQKFGTAFNQVLSVMTTFYHSMGEIVQRCMKANKVLCSTVFMGI